MNNILKMDTTTLGLIAVVVVIVCYYYYNNRKEGFDPFAPHPIDSTIKMPPQVTFADRVEEIKDDEYVENRRKQNNFPSVPKLVDESEDPMLITGYHVGLDSRGTSLKNGSLSLRRDPYIPKASFDWGNSSIEPDLLRKPI